MKYRVLFHPRADQELVELHDYINDVASSERALAFMAGIRDYRLDFSTLPKRGTVGDDIMHGVRIAGHRRSVSIAFSVTSDAVLILGIFYGGRNIAPDVLDERD